MADRYDVVIVGGGPAGLTAAIYTGRARLRTLVIERAVTGGQISTTDLVENYPGFPDGVGGFELGDLMHRQALKYNVKTIAAEVTGVEAYDDVKVVHTTEGEYEARAVVIAGGADPNKLGVPGEEEFTGRGVSYCATCDGAFFKDREVAVVGGGDAAIDEGLFLTRYASKVTIIHRRDQLRAKRILQERAFANPRMSFVWDSVVEAIEGDKTVQRLRLRNVKTQEESILEVAGVFVFVGLHPNTDYLGDVLKLDAGGHVHTNLWMETEAPGIFAAGDVRQASARQAVSAAGDGATAAIAVDRYLAEHGGPTGR